MNNIQLQNKWWYGQKDGLGFLDVPTSPPTASSKLAFVSIFVIAGFITASYLEKKLGI